MRMLSTLRRTSHRVDHLSHSPPTAPTPFSTPSYRRTPWPHIFSRYFPTHQANAICEINVHKPGPVGKATTIRAQGGWETVRVAVCFASDDCAAEAAALDA